MSVWCSLSAIFVLVVLRFSVGSGVEDDAEEFGKKLRERLGGEDFKNSIKSELKLSVDANISQAIKDVILIDQMKIFEDAGKKLETIKQTVLEKDLEAKIKERSQKLKNIKTNAINEMKKNLSSIVSGIEREAKLNLEREQNMSYSDFEVVIDSVQKIMDEDVGRLQTNNPWGESNSQPVPIAFTALLSSNVKQDDVIVFDHVVSNLGNGYDNGSGIFTAPVNGVYMFMVSFLVDDGYVNIHLLKNDQEYVRGYAAKYHLEESGFVQTVLKLSLGDQVTVRMIQGNYTGCLRGDYYTSFAGLMIENS